jgi:hypothetical protein
MPAGNGGFFRFFLFLQGAQAVVPPQLEPAPAVQA